MPIAGSTNMHCNGFQEWKRAFVPYMRICENLGLQRLPTQIGMLTA